MHPFLTRVAAYRVDHYLTYEQLARKIAEITGRAFSSSSLFRLLNGQVQPRASSLMAFDQFLQKEEPREKRRPRRRTVK